MHGPEVTFNIREFVMYVLYVKKSAEMKGQELLYGQMMKVQRGLKSVCPSRETSTLENV